MAAISISQEQGRGSQSSLSLRITEESCKTHTCPGSTTRSSDSFGREGALALVVFIGFPGDSNMQSMLKSSDLVDNRTLF